MLSSIRAISLALVFLSGLIPLTLWAETLYVRPLSACANNGDGSAYACAASGGAAGAFRGMANVLFNAADTAGQVDAGDTLYSCGTFTSTDRDTANYHLFVSVSGTATERITIDGDCSGDGGESTSDWDGSSSTLYGLGPHDSAFITFRNLVVHDFASRGGLLYNHATNDVALDKSIILEDLTIQDIRGSTRICLDMRGKNITVRRVTIRNCGSDAIFTNGTGVTVTDSTISGVSLDSGNAGDGIQVSSEADGALIRGNTIDMTSVDSKHCILVQGDVDNGSATIEDNICTALTTATVGQGIRVDNLGTVLMQRNYVTGGTYAYQINANAEMSATLVGNVGVASTKRCLSVGNNEAGTVRISHTSCVGSLGYGLYNDNAAATVALANNLISGGTTCIEKHTSDLETYNIAHGCTNAITESGTPVATGTGTSTADPVLISATDARTVGSSPARRAGTWGYLCSDNRGRPCGAPPDIGAYQSTSGDPAAPRAARN